LEFRLSLHSARVALNYAKQLLMPNWSVKPHGYLEQLKVDIQTDFRSRLGQLAYLNLNHLNRLVLLHQ
jgi:hypothetical protein